MMKRRLPPSAVLSQDGVGGRGAAGEEVKHDVVTIGGSGNLEHALQQAGQFDDIQNVDGLMKSHISTIPSTKSMVEW